MKRRGSLVMSFRVELPLTWHAACASRLRYFWFLLLLLVGRNKRGVFRIESGLLEWRAVGVRHGAAGPTVYCMSKGRATRLTHTILKEAPNIYAMEISAERRTRSQHANVHRENVCLLRVEKMLIQTRRSTRRSRDAVCAAPTTNFKENDSAMLCEEKRS